MNQFKIHFKEKYNLSNYQVAQIIFLLKTIFSEVSKLIIMGLLFHNKIYLYLFGIFVMLFLRCTTGGLHFYTYFKCLAASIIYMLLALYILPNIMVIKYIQLFTLLLCMYICNYIGPVISKYRPAECLDKFKTLKKITLSFIFIYTVILYIMPKSAFVDVGFWIIILHSLQLIIAKISTKGEIKNA